MSKLSKESILPLAAAFAGATYTYEAMNVLDDAALWAKTMYTNDRSTPYKGMLTKKQLKARSKNKAAKKARKRNRK